METQYKFKTIDSFNNEVTFRFDIIENINKKYILIKTKLPNGEKVESFYLGYNIPKAIKAFKK